MTRKARTFFITSVAGLALLTGTAAYANETLIIEDFIGTVIVSSGTSDTLKLDKMTGKRDADIDTVGTTTTIDGGIARPDGRDCQSYYGQYDIVWFKRQKNKKFGGYKDLQDYPQIILDAPADTRLIVRNSILFGTFGDMDSADIDMRHCGKINTGDIAGTAAIKITGSGDMTAGDIGKLDLKITGSGDVDAEIVGDVSLELTGSGDVDLLESGATDMRSVGSGDIKIDLVNGALTVASRGSGDVDIGDINGALKSSSRGSGDFSAGDINGDVIIEAVGSGDFNANRVKGRVSIEVGGSGDVNIDGGEAPLLLVTSRGSSTVRYDGTAQEAELYASGASDIIVYRVTGALSERDSGAADIRIENRD